MLEYINRIFGRQNSRDVAKERLRLVLVHDRASLSPRFLENIREDLIAVISDYMEIDEEAMDVDLTREDDSVALVASIPVLKMRRDAETRAT